jgi:hypothetical protein
MSGIDWIDVTTLLNGLEAIHEVSIELIVTAATAGSGGLLGTTVTAYVPTPGSEQRKTVATIRGSWPDRERPTFDGYVFNQLYALDRAIGQAYAQEELPK